MSTLKKHNTAILGAAFLMATSAVGPGFLTQTATFTESLMASFGYSHIYYYGYWGTA